MKKYWIVLLSLLSLPSAQASEYLAAIGDKHIVPAYQNLADETASLGKSIDVFCQMPSDEGLVNVQAAFKSSFLAWQGAQHIRFGPIEVLLRGHRYQLWPDKRGSVGKHLRRFIVADDASKLNPDSFPDISVSLQGFSVLERLIFANKKPVDFASDLTCALMRSVAYNLKDMSARMLAEWADGEYSYRNFVATAAQGNMIFDDETELQSKLLNNLYTQLQLVAEQKYDRPLGKSLKKAKSKRAEAWRSAMSLAAIEANLEATHGLFTHTFAPLLKGDAMQSKINAAFEDALAQTRAIKMPLAKAVKNAQARELVVAAQKQVHVLKRLVAGDMAKQLELSVGFNSLDGD